ncbi:MAG: L,D-transpeptidase family protein, partial [Haliea sp.]
MENNRLTHRRKNGQQIIAAWGLLLWLAAGVSGAAFAVASPAADTLLALLTPALPASQDDLASGPLTLAELARFYAARDYRPLWSSTSAERAWEAALASLVDDGLDPAWYLEQVPAAATAGDPCRELARTAVWLQAQLDLRFGALDRETVEPLWRLRPATTAEQRQTLLGSANALAANPAAALAAARPDLPVYRALREALRELLAELTAEPWPEVPRGALLRPGQSDPRVPLLRARLQAGYYLPDAATSAVSLNYDPLLVQAVESFQRRHALAVDGLVGPATLAALNETRERRSARLRANLERWRWLGQEQLPHQIVVDIAAAEIRYYRDDELRWGARSTVGRSLRQTPSLRSAVSHFTLNPHWTVPPTILRQDKLPAIRANPEYLAQQKLQVLDAQGQELDPATVDWRRPGAIVLRQQPGTDNALGQVAIRFPNPFSVYLHDTPSKQLFARAQRTDSSGCVRVEDVLTLVEQLL